MSARDMTDETLRAELERGAQNCGVAWTGLAAVLREAATRISSPPADLPATLASVDDVRRVCEAAGLTEWQSHPASKLAIRWGTDEHAIVAMHYDRNQVLVWQPGIALVPVTVPLQWPATVLYSAIQAARSTS